MNILGLKIPHRVVASGGIFKYVTYGPEVPDTFNQCMDYPNKVSVMLICALSNEYQTPPMIRGDEGTIILETDWSSGVANTTIIPRKGAKKDIKGSYSRRHHPRTLEEPARLRAHPPKTGQRRGIRLQRASRAQHVDAD